MKKFTPSRLKPAVAYLGRTAVAQRLQQERQERENLTHQVLIHLPASHHPYLIQAYIRDRKLCLVTPNAATGVRLRYAATAVLSALRSALPAHYAGLTGIQIHPQQ